MDDKSKLILLQDFARKLGEGTRESIMMIGNGLRDMIYGVGWLGITLLMTIAFITGCLMSVVFWSLAKQWKVWVAIAMFTMLSMFIWRTAHAETEDRGPICTALAVYSEGRGEDAVGQAAIAQTVMNRQKLMPYGSDACDVVLVPGQFAGVESWTLPRHPSDNVAWLFARFISAAISTGEAAVPPPIGNALFFKRKRKDDLHETEWMGMPYLGTVGGHDFYGPR